MKLASRSVALALALTLAAAQGATAQEAAAPAAAQSTASSHADALFSEGKAKLAAQDYAEACRLFAGSFAMDPATGTLLALALCHERAGDIEQAISEYRSAAERAQQEGRKDRAEAATRRADELEAQLAPKPAPAPVRAVVEEKPRSKPLPLRPLEPEYEQPESRGLSTGQWAGLVTASAGVVALGFGAGFALHASSLNDDSKAGCDGDVCTTEARQTRLDAVSAGNVASATALAGAVLVTVGAAIFFSSDTERPSDYALAPWVAPNAAGATASGRF